MARPRCLDSANRSVDDDRARGTERFRDEGAIAYDAIMRWESEGGALIPAGSPGLERRHRVAAHTLQRGEAGGP
jgi:hypothetical protein